MQNDYEVDNTGPLPEVAIPAVEVPEVKEPIVDGSDMEFGDDGIPTSFKLSIGETPYVEGEDDDTILDIDNLPEGKRYRANEYDVPFTTFNYPNLAALEAIGINEGKSVLNVDQYSAVATNHTPLNIFETFVEKGRLWTNRLKNNGVSIDTGSPRLGGEITEDKAIERMRRQCSNGRSLTFPLVHSGIWVTMTPPGERAMVDLDLKLRTQSAAVGISTTGLLLNASSGVFSSTLIDFALRQLSGCNIKNQSEGIAESVRSRADKLDYQILCWGLLATLYPDGYPWEFKCANPNCNAVRTGALLNFNRCYRKDLSALSASQLDTLERHRFSLIDDAALAAYANEFKLTDKDSYLFEDLEIRIYFKRSSLRDYCDGSMVWVNDVRDSYTNALKDYRTEEERYIYLGQQAQVRRIAKYAHMVDRIEYTDDGTIVSDPNDVYNSLCAMSCSNDSFLEMEEAAIMYIQANTISIIGHVADPCKVCNVPFVNSTNARFKTIVPLPADRIFFTLVRQKSSVIAKLADNL